MSEKFETCPFCGGETIFRSFVVMGKTKLQLYCPKCGYSTAPLDTQKEAIERCRKTKERLAEFSSSNGPTVELFNAMDL